MNKYISADKLESRIYRDFHGTAAQKIKEIIRGMPAEDVKPIVRGYWRNSGIDAYCSVCGSTPEHEQGENAPETEFCPNCGAKMED